jgi:hypothetical protein
MICYFRRDQEKLQNDTPHSFCFSGIQPNMTTKKSPPKFAMANGFVIGSLPQVLTATNGKTKK